MPLNSRENAQTYSVESLVDRHQHHETDEHHCRVPLNKSDMVREDLSDDNPGNTEDYHHQATNDVSSEFAYPNLCCS